MDNVKKYLNIAQLFLLLAACWGEFILCFARGYSELWYSVLVFGIITSALAAAAFFTRHKYLYFIASSVVITGAVLLIGFPAYVAFAALICGGLSLAGEAAVLVLHLKRK